MRLLLEWDKKQNAKAMAIMEKKQSMFLFDLFVPTT